MQPKKAILPPAGKSNALNGGKTAPSAAAVSNVQNKLATISANKGQGKCQFIIIIIIIIFKAHQHKAAGVKNK